MSTAYHFSCGVLSQGVGANLFYDAPLTLVQNMIEFSTKSTPAYRTMLHHH